MNRDLSLVNVPYEQVPGVRHRSGIGLRSIASDTVFGCNLVYEAMSDMSEVTAVCKNRRLCAKNRENH